MITLTAESWSRIPLQQAAPYNQHDIVIYLSHKVAIVLRDIRDFSKKRFSIASVMLSDAHRDVFFSQDDLNKMKEEEKRLEVFKQRLLDFASNMDVLLERYFVTNKMPRYLYFDKKEQQVLKQILSTVPLMCSISILRKVNGTFTEVPIDDLSAKGVSKLQDMMKPMRLKVELTLEEYFRMHGKTVRKDWRSREELILSRIFKEYPELNVQTMDEFKKASRKLAKELHPDQNQSENASDTFQAYKAALEELKKTAWYVRLENAK